MRDFYSAHKSCIKMSPYANGNISLTDSDRFGSASSFDPLDCSSLRGRTIAVRHLQRLNAQKNSGQNSGCSLTSRSWGSRRKSFDDYDAEYLRRSLQSDEELMSALTLADDIISALTLPPPPAPTTRELLSTSSPPPPPPSRSPNRLSKSAQENVERYKKLYDAELQDVLKALKADDPTADISLSDHGASPTIAPRNYDDNSNYEVLEQITEPTAIEKGFDPPPSKSDDFQPPAITMMPSEDSLSDCSTVVIDCDNESHDVMSLLSDSNDGLTMESFPPANKMRSSATNEKRRPRKDHAKGKKRRPKSGGDRGRQGRPSSTSRTKKRSDDDEEKKSENIVQRGRQSSRSKSPFAIYVRGRSPSPAGNDDKGPAQTVSKPHDSPYNKLRSISPFHRSSSTGQQDAAGADVSPNKSLSREKPGHPSSATGLSSTDVNHSDEKKKAKLMKKMKTIASGLKHRLGESKKLLTSGSASHVFKGGDVAEYRLGSRVCLEDLEYFIGEDGYTKMCPVRILEVAEDAVYGHPLYTILLPNGSKRQTNGNFLTPPCSKQKTAESYRSRHQSAMKLKSRNRSSARTSSKHHSRSRSVESNSSRRSNRSTSSHRSSSSHRSTSSHRSSSSHRSTSSHRSSSHHHPRQSHSSPQHQSKSRQINYHRYGSNDRSSPRSKQRKQTAPTENVHISGNRDFDESKTQRW